jgi:hypothetical protein
MPNPWELWTKVSTNIIRVGTSGTQFPNVEGNRHIIKALHSGIVFIGASTVNSGTGNILAGDINGAGASIDLKAGNLNILYGIAVTSAVITHISFN